MILSELVDLAKSGKKIEAIKALRDSGIQYAPCEHGLDHGHYYPTAGDGSTAMAYCGGNMMGLKDAKEVVEILMGTHRATPADEYTSNGWLRDRVKELEVSVRITTNTATSWQNSYLKSEEELDAAQERIRALEAFIIDAVILDKDVFLKVASNYRPRP
jgi:hypothetical protein